MRGVNDMEWHFGYNCRHYIPALQKCRKLIDNYGKRADLVEQKWLSARELLLYLGLSRDALFAQIETCKIKVKVQKDGKLTFGLFGAWQYDDCFSKSSGGQCLYYEPHGGMKISCLADLTNIKAEHPNAATEPNEAEIRAFEADVRAAVTLHAES